ncbi:hypothetical protein L6R46_23030, partial [Myxococcota bacterium]|nr:hypothetical protein [Myxococcota bacterium]
MPTPPSRRRVARLRLPSAPTRTPSPLTLLACMGLAVASLAPVEARAEGSAQFGVTQQLQAIEGGTSYNQFYVDILDYTKEKIKWTGSGSLLIYSSSGTYLTTLTSTRSYTPTANGTYILLMTSNQTSTWDVEVTGQIDSGYGRLWSYYWHMNTGSFTDAYSFTGSVYALVYNGSTGDSAVIEMKTDGLSGFDYYILANSVGITDANGRSIEPDSSSSLTYEHPIYLRPPSVATYSFTSPAISLAEFSGGAEECSTVSPGYSSGEFKFTSSTDGTGHIICDLNGDGDFDLTSDDDLHLVFSVFSGDNNTTWDGTDNAGNDVADGTYDCIGMVTVGEFHYVGIDIETSYSGFRLFTLDASLNRTGLTMYWNDADVQANDVLMPSGAYGLESSGGGIKSGNYTDTVTPNVNARSWGAFKTSTSTGYLSKGDFAWMDTYAFVDSDISSVFTVSVVSATLDTDSDGVLDVDEESEYGTDINDADTDHDGLDDGDE